MVSADMLKRRVLAAKGKIPFDKFFYDLKLINVYTEQIIPNASIGIIDGIIVSVCPSFKVQAKETVDCGGMYMSPSFIDAHMHIESSHLTPAAYCEGAVPHGTGCIFTDPMQIANAAGESGLKSFCKMMEKLPVRCYIQFPSHVPASEGMETSGGFFTSQDTQRLMKEMSAVTLGEVNGADLENCKTIEKIISAKQLGLPINGHCPALGHDNICTAVAAGLCDDHESETYGELSDRLSAGMAVLVREGTIEHNCAELISGAVKDQLPTDSMMFCTDDKSPWDIKENGCIDNAVRIAVKCGMSFVKAIKMATLNAARHYGIEYITGSCTPGRSADFILFSDPQKLDIKDVYYQGKLVAQNGRLIERHGFELEKDFPGLCNTVILPQNISEKDLTPSLPEKSCEFTAAVIKLREGSLMTEKITAQMKGENGFAIADLDNDILPIAVVERFGKSGKIGCGLIKGLGIKKGAIAASTAQEGNNIVVSGASYSDMLKAVKKVAEIGGGAVICIDGKITAMQKYPAAGILGVGTIDEEIKAAERFSRDIRFLGSKSKAVLSGLIVSVCPSIPEIGLTDMGVIDAVNNKIIPCVYDIKTLE